MEPSALLPLCEALEGHSREWLHKRGLWDSTIRKYMLGWDEERKSIVIPYLNSLGKIRKLRYRQFDREPKYIWGSEGEKGAHLFHVKATRKPKVWLTEGEFDAMCLAQLGFPSVAVPGASLFKPEWKYLFAYCEQLTVVFDPDESGFRGSQRINGILGPVVDKIRMVKLPEGKDVSDLYVEDKAVLLSLVK